MLQYLTNIWPELQVDLIAIAIELCLVYVVINYLLWRREEKRWLPVRRIVVLQLAKTNVALFNAAHQLMKELFVQGPLPPYEASKLFLRQLIGRFERLRNLADANNVAFGPKLMPSIAVFVDQTERALRKLTFFAEVHNQQLVQMDIVGESPLGELERVEAATQVFRNSFPKVFADSSLHTVKLLSTGELRELWARAEREITRLCLDPKSYTYEAGRVAYVYDLDQLRALPRPSVQGVGVRVFDQIGA